MSGGKQHILSADTAGDLRARDVRYHLKGEVSPKVLFVLESFAEKLHVVDKGLADVVMLVNQMADITSQYVGVAERMKQTINGIRDAAGDPTLGMLSTPHEGEPN
jgi:hypothetical protein